MVGRIYGKVTQMFLEDSTTYVNSLKLGPLEVFFQAEKSETDDWTNEVVFRRTCVKLFGRVLIQKDFEINGGVWNYRFLGTIDDADGKAKLVRKMETPSLHTRADSIIRISHVTQWSPPTRMGRRTVHFHNIIKYTADIEALTRVE